MPKEPIEDEPVHVFEEVRYEFSVHELRELGAKLAEAAHAARELQRQKTTAAANFAASIKSADDIVAGLTDKIRNGYETRLGECIVRLDCPRPGLKEYVRLDTGEVAREAAMSPSDMQRALPLDGNKRVQ
jgi:hypothetical protein